MPDASLRKSGFAPKQAVKAAYFNWKWNLLSRWIRYLDSSVSSLSEFRNKYDSENTTPIRRTYKIDPVLIFSRLSENPEFPIDKGYSIYAHVLAEHHRVKLNIVGCVPKIDFFYDDRSIVISIGDYIPPPSLKRSTSRHFPILNNKFNAQEELAQGTAYGQRIYIPNSGDKKANTKHGFARGNCQLAAFPLGWPEPNTTRLIINLDEARESNGSGMNWSKDIGGHTGYATFSAFIEYDIDTHASKLEWNKDTELMSRNFCKPIWDLWGPDMATKLQELWNG